tara:strand:+ start:77 stop:322 length:246 start_codon:yes stop_codon:yes gene_type:complete
MSEDKFLEQQREKLLSDLILSDVGAYRRIGLLEEGKFKREPTHYYLDLLKIYSQLSTESIKMLLEIKPKLTLESIRQTQNK